MYFPIYLLKSDLFMSLLFFEYRNILLGVKYVFMKTILGSGPICEAFAWEPEAIPTLCM